jgi:hypothetical protein
MSSRRKQPETRARGSRVQQPLPKGMQTQESGKEKPGEVYPQIKGLLWWALALLVILVSFWLFLGYHTWQEYSQCWDLPPVRVLLSSPRYLSPGEEEEIRFAAENHRDSVVQVAFRLINEGALLSFFGTEGSNVFYAGPVQAQEQISRKFRVFFPFSFSFSDRQASNVLGKSAGLSLWGSVDGQVLQRVADLPLSIAPFPQAKAWCNRVGATLAVLVLWLIKEVWSQVKEVAKAEK